MNELVNLQNKIKSFCEERDWNQFHNPKDLAIGLVTEASELLDIFRFKTENDIKKIMNTNREHIGEELADVMFFLFRFAQMYNFDLYNELESKLVKNAKKYPVEKAKGSNKKYTEE